MKKCLFGLVIILTVSIIAILPAKGYAKWVLCGDSGCRSWGSEGAFIGVLDEASGTYESPLRLAMLTQPEISVELKYTESTIAASGQNGVEKSIVGSDVLGDPVNIVALSSRRTCERARKALADGNPTMALDLLNPVLQEDPGDMEARQLAVKAAETHVDNLLKSMGAQEALLWLEKKIDDKPYLESLRLRIPELDTLAVVDVVLVYADKKTVWAEDTILNEFKQLLARYPRSAEVPIVAARSLKGKIEGKVGPYVPLWLYEQALKRGADSEKQHIFSYCLEFFGKYRIIRGNRDTDTAHRIVGKYFESEGLQWADRALDEEESPSSLNHAWYILEKNKDPRTEDPYYKRLLQITYAYENRKEEADAALQVFLKQQDVSRQKHIIAVHRRWLKPRNPGSIPYRLVEQNLAELEARWSSP